MPDLSLAAHVSALDPYRITTRSSADARIVTGTGADWFGPQAPMAPLAPGQVAGRQLDYPPGFNLVTQPRAYEPIGFADLRAIADSYDLIRIIIETRKDQMARLEWSVRPRERRARAAADGGQIKTIAAFLRKPDGSSFWDTWLRELLEDLLVIDAPALWAERNRGGALVHLHPIDGATIKRVIDDWGRTPHAPLSAYQQVLHGLPAVDYTTRDIIYRPRNTRVHKVYGFSPVEQILITVNIALRRQIYQLQYYTEGNIPEALIGAPESWTPVQLGNVLGMETLLATNGGLNWGGCDIWVSSDDVTFKYAGTLQGGTAMGITTAALAAGSDPDTVHTLAVDLTPSRGVLLPGTAADADQGNTLCLVGGELVAYQQATLTAQYRYDLGVHGASAGYLRRGFYATAIVSHASGAAFVRLREGSYFTIGYGAGQIGQTIHVKLLSFNKWGGGRQRLDQVTSYPHVLAAPPISSAGLLPGIIQTPDIALQAATGQVTANVAGPVGIGATMASIITASLATTGQLVQLVYNLQFGNPTGSTQTYDWLFFRDATAIDSGSITVTPGAISTIVRQITDTPAAATHVFKIEAQYTGLTGSGSTASFIDLSATELKR